MKERFFAGLLRNLSAGTRLALFLPVRWLHFRATPGQFALLAVFNLLVWVLSATLQADGGALNPQAVAVYLAQIPVLLLACLAIASIHGNASLATLLAVAASYTYEQGEREHPRDAIYVREMAEVEVKPKAVAA